MRLAATNLYGVTLRRYITMLKIRREHDLLITRISETHTLGSCVAFPKINCFNLLKKTL